MTGSKFGITARGQTVHRVELRNGPLTVSLLTFGAILQGVWLRGIPHSLTLGSDRLDEYETTLPYHGAIIAPVVNRLTNAAASIAGAPHRFEANQDGRHTLHSGSAGSHRQVWTLAALSDTAATLTLILPDGAGGFPGTRAVRAAYSVPDAATLRLQITATTDRTTLMNPANHSYWNLDGTPDWSGHTLQIDADRYLPTTDAFVPTGEIRPTPGTELDFRRPRVIRPGDPPLDTCFCLADRRRLLTPVLTLTGQNRVSMTVATTEPGLQVYDGRAAIRPGRAACEGLAIEPQNWPDAPNHPGFPGIELDPGQTYDQTTEWRFAAA